MSHSKQSGSMPLDFISLSQWIQPTTNWWYFFLFSPETICMKCQSLFSAKNIYFCWIILPSMLLSIKIYQIKLLLCGLAHITIYYVHTSTKHKPENQLSQVTVTANKKYWNCHKTLTVLLCQSDCCNCHMTLTAFLIGCHIVNQKYCNCHMTLTVPLIWCMTCMLYFLWLTNFKFILIKIFLHNIQLYTNSATIYTHI